MTQPVTPFGNRKPPAFWQSLIALCHDNNGGIISRTVAPLIRKMIVKQKSLLPVDIEVEGINLRCQFTDNYSEKKFVFTPWRYDRAEREMLSQALNEGGTFVDIGANIGIYTLTAVAAMGSHKGRIIAFEPNPATLARLRFNIQANSQFAKNNILVLNHGIADEETSFFLQHDANNLGKSSIRNVESESDTSDNKQGITIKCRPLLPVLSELEINEIDALKIDIEGAEDLALTPFLNSAPDSLLPRLLIIENSEHQWKSDLFQTIRSRGYALIQRGKMNSIFLFDPGAQD
ncbi:FkbM family methyltransferase [Marinobacter orientalis]|uniref:FkbM family methyltransferase n=1 Tax=Marinobacter orientalis TaxID=1928859 RepID=A0A7Y0RFH9_9GAMM|nr:FkbM family methyltransferase [Marinobacter orientalis]NMT65301.1 FkbM family methyltransferase [Marinobacter orientalis]TGX47929.1 FkbM family methyltransferase [Marinobacter orientalis]